MSATSPIRVYRKLAAGDGGGGEGGGVLEPSRKAGAAWRLWRAAWRNNTELALTLRGIINTHSVAAACDEAERMAAKHSTWWARLWPG